MNRGSWPFLLTPALAALLLSLAGCVERKYLVLSEPEGAYVRVNDRPLQTSTPADGYFLYHGVYDFTLIKDGFEPLHVRQPLPAKWYEYPPLDFIAENLVPFLIKDERRLGPYPLQPLLMPRIDEVVSRGEILRQDAKSLGGPAVRNPWPGAGVAPTPPVGPPPAPLGQTPPAVAPVPALPPPAGAVTPPGIQLTPSPPAAGFSPANGA